jgi:hypothetical protein
VKKGDRLEKKYRHARITAIAHQDKEYTATITFHGSLNIETRMDLERLLSWDLELLAAEMRE